MRAGSSDMKDRTADVLMLFATSSAQTVCSIFVLSQPGEAIDQSWPQHGLRVLDREKGAGRAQGAPDEAGL